jgi:predicted nucleotide-binding protein
MLHRTSFALLVLTAEDEHADGSLHARQNVVHEAGLFQGRLGFSRAVLLLEDGCDEFTNIHGVQQIRFSKGNIKETFGDVLATLRREFAG